MKALRLPTRASAVAYLFRSRRPRLPPCSCSPQRSRKIGQLFRTRTLGQPGIQSPARSTWTRMGPLRSSGDPSRAFAPFQDPGRTDVASPWTATPVLPPLPRPRRLRHWLISGLTRSFGTCCHTLHASHCCTRARLASGWPARPLPRGSRTHWTATRGFRSSHPPLLLS
jgi:hypothetical protein